MKTNNENVAHIWAQNDNNTAESGNMECLNGRIYSYNQCIGKFLDNENVLIINYNYSATTSKHNNYVNRALNGLNYNVFSVENVDINFNDKKSHLENLEIMVNEINDLIIKQKRARVHDYMDYITRSINSAIKYATVFKIRNSKTYNILKNIDLSNLNVLSDEIKKAKQQKIINAKNAMIKAKQKKLNDFKNTNGVKYNLDYDYLKLRDDEVITSSGTRVPLINARLLLRALNRGDDINGQKIGYYTVISHNDTSIKIGCHNLLLSDVKAVLSC